ncbi:cellulose synthase complex periplasmic endoglucanase BcsZ [Zobellella sp. DQSA1]|uniref:cellulose synthase complex periplasmic endoglucanase BcsZ n=1 Tax=Zobellella sp. DQSA1 TaxID=3342386 RepID=UPI0035C040BD
MSRLGMMLIGLLLAPLAWAGCDWPEWHGFKEAYIGPEGRVIDPVDGRDITTSEGQSYGMFFALVADDREAFERLLRWTEENLAEGDLTARLPAWLWGRDEQRQWSVLDDNSASDSDLWIAYALLEAGRLWQIRKYRVLGTLLLQRIAREEVMDIPGLGMMLLPGRIGFAKESHWTLNPSYLPPQLLARFAELEGPWREMRGNNLRLWLESAPRGLVPDWISWHGSRGWQPAETSGSRGSYDAIRSYLWAGMLAGGDPDRVRLLEHLQPMVELTTDAGPPERVDAQTGEAVGRGPVGFSAALLPMLQNGALADAQRRRLATNPPGDQAYYDSVLTLFGLGWDQRRYRFDEAGKLLPEWDQSCAINH